MDAFQLVILSIIQGLTEFLPISSSAHLILFSNLINKEDQGIFFDVAVHFGTLLAATFYFRDEIKRMILNLISGKFIYIENSLFINLLVSVIPILILGYYFRSFVELNLRDAKVIAYATIGFGLLLYFASRFNRGNNSLDSITIFQALFIGLFQCLALIPGTSRSGITISAGLLLGLNPTSASKFSFLLAIPTIGAITIAELLLISTEDLSQNLTYLLVAFSISFVVAYITIDLFLKLIERIGFTPFVIYRLVLGFWILIFLV